MTVKNKLRNASKKNTKEKIALRKPAFFLYLRPSGA